MRLRRQVDARLDQITKYRCTICVKENVCANWTLYLFAAERSVNVILLKIKFMIVDSSLSTMHEDSLSSTPWCVQQSAQIPNVSCSVLVDMNGAILLALPEAVESLIFQKNCI